MCCILPAFDAAQGFGHDKPACSPCRHLRPDNRCAIHENLSNKGYIGCISFNCHGAGQRTTAFLGLSTISHGGSRSHEEVYDCFRRIQAAHQLMYLITSGLRTADTPVNTQELEDLFDQVAALGDEALISMPAGMLEQLRLRALCLLRERLA